MASDPEFAVDAIGEELGRAAVVRAERRAASDAPLPCGLEDEQRAGFAVADQIREVAATGGSGSTCRWRARARGRPG